MIRKAEYRDLDAIAALETACFRPAQAADRETFAARLRVYPDHFWLLEEEGRLIAMVDGLATDQPDLLDELMYDPALHEPEGQWQMLFGVITHPERRGEHKMTALLEQVIADTKAQGRKGLVLTCLEEMLAFYTRFGFVNEGRGKSVHNGLALYQMRLTFPRLDAAPVTLD